MTFEWASGSCMGVTLKAREDKRRSWESSGRTAMVADKCEHGFEWTSLTRVIIPPCSEHDDMKRGRHES